MASTINNGHIYLVTNTINGKQYVGQTIKVNNTIGHGMAITDAYKKHGKRYFTYERICSGINDRNTLNYIERFWIKAFNSIAPNGYNIEDGGSGHSDHNKGRSPWNKGLKTPDHVKVKLSLAKKGLPGSRKGKKHTQESIIKISLAKKGCKLSDEVYKQQAMTRTGKKHKIVECPHCHKTGGETAMPRWHFDNCKEKK